MALDFMLELKINQIFDLDLFGNKIKNGSILHEKTNES